jgi:ankyrin repeat protein
LVHAVIGGSIGIIETLLKYGARVNIESYEFGCPLKAAIEGGDPKMVELLLRSNIVVNFSENGNPLLSAAKNGDLEIVKLLIVRGVDVNI